MDIKHTLHIRSLFDAQAECKCGGWYMSFTGELSKKDIQKEYSRHIRINKTKK
jgi:hypothetical protein